MAPRTLHIFTAIHAEAKAIRRVLPAHCELHVIGIRAVRLPDFLSESRGIIMAGFGGALDPSLKIGAIIVDDPPARIFTSDVLITTPAQKADLFRQTGAQVVDMENSIVREFAKQMGVPFIGIRSVSDTADEGINPAVLSFVDEIGRPQPGKIALALLKRPSLIPTLRRLAANSSLAADRLAEAVARIAIRDFANDATENRNL